MSQANNLALICTGFHRSATSATANYLYDAGLDLGSNLMGGNISNAKGHFEDWDAVKLHDSFLAESGSSWQFHDDCQLQGNSEQIQYYVQQREKQSAQWGVKDPRACLFLDDWGKVLGDNGRYLFIVRHWSSCIESLLHRHSRDLAHNLPQLNADNTGLQFWLTPELAARMWLSYNQRLLAFAKQNRSNVLLVTQRALFEGAPVLSFLNDKFNFRLDSEVASPFEESLLRDQASSTVFDSLSYSLRARLDKLSNELLALADFKSANEQPLYSRNSDIANEALAPLHQAIEKFNEVSSSVVTLDNYDSTTVWLAKLAMLDNAEQVIIQLDSTPKKALLGVDITELQRLINGKYALNGQVSLSLAKLLMRLELYQSAISCFQKTIALGLYFPYIDMLLAQCYQQLSLSDETHFFFNKAIKANPNNPSFYTKKAAFLLSLGENKQAENNFEQGYQIGSKQPACVLPYCEYLVKSKRQAKAEQILATLIEDTDNPAALNMLTRLKLSADLESGKNHYLANIKAKLVGKNKINWLAQACSLISNGASETDFINRVYQHWDNVEESGAERIEK